MTTEQDENLKRWTAKRRSALVLEILRGDTSVVEAARKHALTVCSTVTLWSAHCIPCCSA